jgi:hypothetical protein
MNGMGYLIRAAFMLFVAGIPVSLVLLLVLGWRYLRRRQSN